MAEGFSNEDLENLKNHWKETAEAQQRASESLKAYNDLLKQIREVRRSLNYLDQQERKLKAEVNAFEKEHKKLLDKQLNASEDFTDEDKERLKIIKQTIVNRQAELKILQKETSELKQQAKTLAEAANSANVMSAAFSSMGKGAAYVGKTLLNQTKYLLEQQKAVRETELSMGILSKQAGAFRDNIYKASLTTNALGVDAKELAKMQGAYSEQVGRSVELSQEGLAAMAELSKGTILGSEGAAELVANMDAFGISATGTKAIVEDMLNTAHKMGVNSAAVTKNLQKNLKLANRYHFKDGVKGITTMAAAAAKFKIDMEGIGAMADKAFRPEGAVEMAAELQTMGGEFAKLADPFSLMFKARNDFEGFTMDIVNATKEMATFNEKTGEFEFSGLQLDRMKEISRITGISSEQLATMSREAAKFEKIQSQMSGQLTNDNQEFLSSIATFNADTKTWQATVGGVTKDVKGFSNQEIERIKKEKQNLADRAKQAQTFDETWENIKNTFKSTLLPLMEGISEGLQGPMEDFLTYMKKSGGFEKLADVGRSIGEFAGTLIKFVAENPFKSLLVALGGWGALKMATWVMNGRALGMGFNSVASVGGGKGGGGLGDLFGGRGGRGGKGGFGGLLGKGGFGRSGKLSLGKSLAGGLKGGLGLGLLGGALDMGREMLPEDYQEGNTGKLMGVGGTAASWAGSGAMLGSIIPGVGTLIGGILGGVAGGIKGIYDEYLTGPSASDEATATRNNLYDDVIVRAGQPPIGINPADDVIAAKKGGPIDKALAPASNSNNSVGGATVVSFSSPLKIEGRLELSSGGSSGNIDLNDPHLLRELSKYIQMELSKAINGGKMSANPS
jgi:ABC-type transporter Mla subunit MlaD